MKIVLFATALPETLFNEAGEEGIRLNPAAENFYLRLLATFETALECKVITFAPSFSFDPSLYQDYVFVRREKSRKETLRNVENAFEKLRSTFEPDVLICESLNLALSSGASKIFKKHNLPLVSVLTDAPENITGASFPYRFLCKRYAKKANAYLALTEGLLETFSAKKKPHFLFPGIVEPFQKKKPLVQGDYYYYGGALFEKDGTGSLVRAYLASNSNIPLYIAGHGPMEEEIKNLAAQHPSLHFMGQLIKEENIAMEQHATVLINPRWYREDLDSVSVPSKNLEYLSNGNRIASTPNSILKSMFPGDVDWLPKEASEIEKSLRERFENGFQDAPINNAKEKIQDLLGYEALGKKFLDFLLRL